MLQTSLQLFDKMPQCHVGVWNVISSRLHFQHFFVEECDGLILIENGSQSVKLAFRHQEVRGFEVIEREIVQMEASYQGVASCTNIMTFTAIDAIVSTNDSKIWIMNLVYDESNFIPHVPWYVEVYVNYILDSLDDWVFECCDFLSCTWSTLVRRMILGFIFQLTNGGWKSDSKNWYFDHFFCIVNKLGCYRYMEDAELVIQVYVFLSNICVTSDLWTEAKLDNGKSMLVHVYNSLAWKLYEASLYASFHHLTTDFLPIFRHTKLLVVLHRKMIFNGSFYAPRVLIMWKDSFSKHGSYSNITLGIAPMIIMHFNCRSLNWFLKIFNTMVNRDTIYWRAFMSAYLKVNYFKGVSSLESIPISLGITTCQAICFAVVLKFEGQKYFVVAVLHRKVIPRGQWLLVQSIEIFRLDRENVAGSLDCNFICILLAIAVCVNKGSVIITKILLKWRDLPTKRDTWKFAVNVDLVVAILHRKMIERGSVHASLVLLKWKFLPPKHGTWKFSSLRTRMFEGEGIVTGISIRILIIFRY
jgi:hypothetical protein